MTKYPTSRVLSIHLNQIRKQITKFQSIHFLSKQRSKAQLYPRPPPLDH